MGEKLRASVDKTSSPFAGGSRSGGNANLTLACNGFDGQETQRSLRPGRVPPRRQKPRTIELPNETLLPGPIEWHSHMFLHPYNETPWNGQVLNESLAERVARAPLHAASA